MRSMTPSAARETRSFKEGEDATLRGKRGAFMSREGRRNIALWDTEKDRTFSRSASSIVSSWASASSAFRAIWAALFKSRRNVALIPRASTRPSVASPASLNQYNRHCMFRWLAPEKLGSIADFLKYTLNLSRFGQKVRCNNMY